MPVANPPEIIQLLHHPLRRHILQHYMKKAEPLSPGQVSRELGERLNNVSYHTKVLCEGGALNLVRERPVRGAVEHLYLRDESLANEPLFREALDLPELPQEAEE